MTLRYLPATLLAALALVITTAATAAPASAATPAPHWQLSWVAQPTNLLLTNYGVGEPGDRYALVLTNSGQQASAGTVTLTLELPTGVSLAEPIASPGWECPSGEGATVVTCLYNSPIPALQRSPVLTVPVAAAATGPGSATVTVSGGNAPVPTTASRSTEVTAPGGPLPSFGFVDFSDLISDVSGLPDTQAGDHPFALTTTIDFPQREPEDESEINPGHAVQSPKAVQIDLPAGLAGNAQAAPTCPIVRVLAQSCPADTQVGTFMANYNQGLFSSGEVFPIYNVVPERGYPAEFGFFASSVQKVAFVYASVRAAPEYGLHISIPDLPNEIVTNALATFYGDPQEMDGTANSPIALLTNPSDCSGEPLVTTAKANSWEEPDDWVETKSIAPPVSGCHQLQFQPTVTVKPKTTSADQPAGYTVDLEVPQSQAPGIEGLATPDLKDATLALPQGVSISPAAGDGLEGCAAEGPEGIELSSEQPGNCPLASQIGSVEATTPLLGDPLKGHLYVPIPGCGGEGKPPCTAADAANGTLFGVYLELEGAGVVIKQHGTVSADPTTGQLSASFKNAPQFPFDHLHVTFKDGSRAPLRTPSTCGTFTTTTDLVPWSAPETPDANPSSSFTVSSGPNGSACATSAAQRPLAPTFSAGTTNPVAGAFSPFVMHLRREDGEQELSTLNVSTPPGIAADLRGVPYCSDAVLAEAAQKSGAGERANPSCPAASQIGTVNVGAGAGPDPFYVPGKVYLAGPYKGAPLSLAIVTPALAGPFDLGTVVVRAATYLDPSDAHLRVVSDPLPKILAGIPLDIRDVRVNIDRPHFTNNPTDCEPMSLFADVFGAQGAASRLTNRFQVGDCEALAFKPKLALSLSGATKRTGHPALSATLRMKPGEANIAAAQVTLPHSEFLDQAHIGTVCTRVQFAAKACPATSIYGHATATTPLLDQPLSGPVYLRSSSNKLPDLVADLNGQVEVTLDGKVDTGKGGGIRNTFTAVPDAPVSKFTLSMQGGSKGLLVNSENICSKPQRAIANFTAQNGKVSDTKPVVSNSCKAKPHRTRKRGGEA